MSTLWEYFDYQEKHEAELGEICMKARRAYGLIPDPYEDEEDTGCCECCPVNLAGKCPLNKKED